MASPTDPNQVRLTGENSFIRLRQEEGGPETTRTSHWRILHSPGGPGHVLYIKSELTNDEVRIYSDNIAMARWLQGEIESMLFPDFADESIPVIDADFSRAGDTFTFCTETVDSEDDSISLTWYDLMEPYMVTVAAGSTPGRAHGVYSCFIPARKAQLMLNGMAASGSVSFEKRGDRDTSSACLAWSETWVKLY